MKKLLIVQVVNANKGNSSVIFAMKKSLLEHYSDIDIALTAFDPGKAEKEFELNAAGWIIDFKNMKHASSKVQMLLFMLKEFLWILYSLLWIIFFKIGLKLPLPTFKRKTIELYLNSDVIVLPGGHSFTNFNGFPLNISHAYALLYAKWLGKKTMIYAQTVGPFFGKFGGLTKIITDYVVKHTDIVSVREEDSLKNCPKNKKIYVTAETVFALPSDRDIAKQLHDLDELKKSSKPIVGVTIHHIYYKHFLTREEYVKLMATLFDKIIEKFNCNILIIPMEVNYQSGGDRPIASEMIALCKHKEDIHILAGDHDSLITSSVIANMDIFVGTKTHSIVYGLKSNTPTISISYQQKSNEFMKMFNVLDNAINLESLNVDDFMAIFERVVENRKKYEAIEKEAYAAIKEKALNNNALLYSLFNKS